jgi:excisionase family DNA binding protein
MTHSDHPELGRVWLTPAEVHTITGIGRTEIYTALQTCELRGSQRGKNSRWRIHRDDVTKWIDSQARQPVASWP